MDHLLFVSRLATADIVPTFRDDLERMSLHENDVWRDSMIDSMQHVFGDAISSHLPYSVHQQKYVERPVANDVLNCS